MQSCQLLYTIRLFRVKPPRFLKFYAAKVDALRALKAWGELQTIFLQQGLVPQKHLGGAVGDKAAGRQQEHAGTGLPDEVQVVGDDQLCLGQGLDRLDDQAAVIRVQRVGWLVQDDGLRLHGQDRRDGGHALFPARELVVVAVLQMRQIQPRQGLIHPGLGGSGIHAAVAQAEAHILIDRRHKQLVVRVLQDVAQTAADGREIFLADRQPVDENLPVAGEKAQQELHQRRLAGAVGPNDPDGFPVGDLAGQILQHRLARLILK